MKTSLVVVVETSLGAQKIVVAVVDWKRALMIVELVDLSSQKNLNHSMRFYLLLLLMNSLVVKDYLILVLFVEMIQMDQTALMPMSMAELLELLLAT
jgi:hypothetical protein